MSAEGYPVVRRFVIRRLPLALASDTPWKLRDRDRPMYFGHYETQAKAIEGVARILRREFDAEVAAFEVTA